MSHMENQDSLTPTQYGKMVGMFPDPPHNPLPTGGYMDAGFDWVVHQAESKYNAEDSDYDDYLDELEEDALVLYKDNPSHLFEKAYPTDYEVGMNDYESLLLADIQSGDTQNSKMFDEDENLTPYGEKVLKEMYDSLIDESLGIEWLASKHPPSELLKRGDPIAYRVGLSEYQDAFERDEMNAETFEAFYIGEDDEGKIHIENKCDGCGKEFLFTQNPNIVGGNRAGAIVYENLEGATGHDYPEYSPYGDLLCKSCHRKEGHYYAETFESPILYDEDGDEVDYDDDDYENSGWEKTYDAESFSANEKPICKCGRYCEGDPRFLEQECLDCKKISHQMCGDGRKAYENCAFCKSFNVRPTNLDEWRKSKGLEEFGAEEVGCDWVQIGHGNHPTKMSYIWYCKKLNAEIDSIKKPSRNRKVRPNSFTQNWGSGKQSHYFGAEMQQISDDEELFVVRNDMGQTKGFVEMEDDLEDESIEIEISDDEMNEIADITLDADFVKPSRDWFSLALGTAAVVIGGSLFLQNRSMFKADGDEMAPVGTGEPSLVAHPSTGDLLPADYEEMIVESTGYAVPIIPVSLDPAFMGSRFHALPTDRTVESNEPGIGAHTDVAMTRDTDFREPEQSMITRFNADGENCECSLLERIKSFFTGKSCCEGKEVKEANSVTGQTPYFGVGFDGKNTQTRVIKETNPISLDPSTAPYIPQNLSGYTGQAYTPPTVYSDMMNIGVSGQNPAFVSTQSSSLQSVHGNLSAGMNQSYTDGSRTMSLSQWSIDYDVSQTSDSEAFAVSRSSGVRTMIRRV